MNKALLPGTWEAAEGAFLSICRRRPDLGEDSIECIEVAQHPDRDGTLLFMHETVCLYQYFIDGKLSPIAGSETVNLTAILAGYGIKNIEDFLYEAGGGEEFESYEINSVCWEVLANYICGSSYKNGIKLSPAAVQEMVLQITDLDYPVDYFSTFEINGYNLSKALRARAGMSQSQFAAHFGVSVRTLQGWEREFRQPPLYVIHMMERILELEKQVGLFPEK